MHQGGFSAYPGSEKILSGPASCGLSVKQGCLAESRADRKRYGKGEHRFDEVERIESRKIVRESGSVCHSSRRAHCDRPEDLAEGRTDRTADCKAHDPENFISKLFVHKQAASNCLQNEAPDKTAGNTDQHTGASCHSCKDRNADSTEKDVDDDGECAQFPSKHVAAERDCEDLQRERHTGGPGNLNDGKDGQNCCHHADGYDCFCLLHVNPHSQVNFDLKSNRCARKVAIPVFCRTEVFGSAADGTRPAGALQFDCQPRTNLS